MATKLAPRRRTPPAPVNQSRGAGQAAPASAAATEPAAGAFYDDGDSPLAAAAPTPRAEVIETITESVRRNHIPIETMGSADVEVVERAAAEQADEDGDSPESLAETIERIRRTRRPVGGFLQKLALPLRRGYHRHWFNDVAGRIDDAKANGWAHVKGTDGQPVARCVGSGRDRGALYAFAMELPDVFMQEDMDARHAAATAKIDALKAGPFRSPSGTAQASDKDKFYSPTEAPPVEVNQR